MNSSDLGDFNKEKELKAKYLEKILLVESIISQETYEDQLIKNERSNPSKAHDAKICNYIVTFIQKNRQLLHLDLTQTKLSEKMLWDICCSITKSRTLVSLHVSENPGITDELKKKLQNESDAKSLKSTGR